MGLPSTMDQRGFIANPLIYLPTGVSFILSAVGSFFVDFQCDFDLVWCYFVVLWRCRVFEDKKPLRGLTIFNKAKNISTP